VPNALINGSALLLLAAWALMSREPWMPHVVVASIGIWLLLAPSLWFFTSRPARWNSIGVGLAALVLAAWTLAGGPQHRQPFNRHGQCDRVSDGSSRAGTHSAS
jgi:hypothetical protein